MGECKQCGRCCYQEGEITIEDIERMSKCLEMSVDDFISKHVSMRMKMKNSGACTLLNQDNKCSIYLNRPEVCKKHFCDEAR